MKMQEAMMAPRFVAAGDINDISSRTTRPMRRALGGLEHPVERPPLTYALAGVHGISAFDGSWKVAPIPSATATRPASFDGSRAARVRSRHVGPGPAQRSVARAARPLPGGAAAGVRPARRASVALPADARRLILPRLGGLL